MSRPVRHGWGVLFQTNNYSNPKPKTDYQRKAPSIETSLRGFGLHAGAGLVLLRAYVSLGLRFRAWGFRMCYSGSALLPFRVEASEFKLSMLLGSFHRSALRDAALTNKPMHPKLPI